MFNVRGQRLRTLLREPLGAGLHMVEWGVDTAAEIAARIYDGNDDPTIFAHFQFEPFATQSVPAAQTSFGGLKALYRNGGQ